jgi:hypothetical protein
VFGNRGRLHDGAGRITRSHAGRRWIACRLDFRGRRRAPMPPGRYTGLFFLDEATALAAGHRPCAECRHPDYAAFVAAWALVHPEPGGAGAIDARLHAERLDAAGARRLHHGARLEDLPDGACVLRAGGAWVVVGARLWRWTPAGYVDPVGRGRGEATLITPPSLVRILSAGWTSSLPLLHDSAGGGA